MPSFDFVRKWDIPDSFRAQSVIGSFTLLDVKLQKRFKGEIPTEQDDWQIGVIVGRSGTGKSSIAQTLWPEAYVKGFEYTHSCFLEDFPEKTSINEITKALDSVGFASPPDWLKSYDCLSQGEKMRVDVARALCLERDLIVFDEWTSVVDREVAKIASYAVSKAIRRGKKKFIAVTCHYDVVDWLEPDWVFCTDNMEFVKKNDTTKKLSSKSINVDRYCGRFLGNITI